MRRVLIIGVLAVVVGVGLFVLRTGQEDIDPRAGSVDLGTGDLVEIEEVPAAYRIVYRVEDWALGTVGSEVLLVERPFRSRMESYDDPEPGGEPQSTEVVDLGRALRATSDRARIALAVPPGAAPFDVRLDTVVDAAVDRGLLEPREQRRVLNRTCQVYRTGTSPRAGELVPSTDDAFVDVCVDASGLVLEEVQPDLRRLAIELDLDPELDEDSFDVGERTLPVDRGGGVVQEVTAESSTPGEFWELGDDLPLRQVGRYAVVPPQPDAFTDPRQRGRRVATLTDVRAAGVDLLVVDRGGSLGGDEVLGEPGEHETTVDLGELGEGTLALTPAGPVVVARLGEGRFVRLSGTLPPADLLAVARDMRAVDGEEIMPVGSAW